MDLNLEPKFGGKPEFTPQFVDRVVRTVLASGCTLKATQVGEFINEEDENKFLDKMEFGQKNGLWSISEDSIVSVPLSGSLLDNRWTPLKFAGFLVDAICARQLGDPTNWNSFAALISWSYALRTSFAHHSGHQVLQLPEKWSNFETIGISTGLSRRNKDGSGLVINETQWVVARKWMHAIGSFVQIDEFKIPSSYLLGHRLKSIVQGSTEGTIPVREIVMSLREKVPFLPGGEYGKMWSAYLEYQWSDHDFSTHVEKDQENFFTQQESLAFITLEAEGFIRLRNINDAGDSLVLTAGASGERRPVSHVDVLVRRDDQHG